MFKLSILLGLLAALAEVAGGVVLVACVHVLLSRSGRGDWLMPPAIIYPALTVLFSIALWAVVFNLQPNVCS